MRVAYKRYTNEILDGLGFLAAWPLNQRIQLGDIGYLEGNIFHRRDHLANWRIDSAPRRSDKPDDREATFDYATEGAIDTTIGASEAGTAGKIELGFKIESALYVRIRKSFVRELDRIDEVGTQILELARTGAWDQDNVVVTEVVEADDVTILVSGAANAKASLGLGLEPLGVAALASMSGSFALRAVGERGLTPLFRVRGVRRRFLRGAAFRDSGSDPAPDEFTPVVYPAED